MTSIEALILPGRDEALAEAVVGGLRLSERAILTLHRAGIDRILVSRRCGLDAAAIARLAQRGVPLTVVGDEPLHVVSPDSVVVVATADAVFEPAAVRSLVARFSSLNWNGVAALEAAPATLAAIAPATVESLRRASEAGLLELLGGLRVARIGSVFCRPVATKRQIPQIERDYITHSNGEEAAFTRVVRLFSLPISRAFLRLRMSANQVTLLGLGLAGLAALLFSHRAYWMAVAGALVYYASTVLDCSDGEVARTSLSDSRFGAWLETITDYLTYFLLMGGLVWGELRYHGFCAHVEAAAVAGTVSLLIVLIVGYLRGRVAAANPGAFDNALAEELNKGTLFQRFAVRSRQLVKRSFLAHLILFQALIGHMPALLKVWAYGSLGALVVLLAVQPALLRRVKVAPIRETSGWL